MSTLGAPQGKQFDEQFLDWQMTIEKHVKFSARRDSRFAQ